MIFPPLDNGMCGSLKKLEKYKKGIYLNVRRSYNVGEYATEAYNCLDSLNCMRAKKMADAIINGKAIRIESQGSLDI